MRQELEFIWARLGKAMQSQAADATHEPLPRRWVDLIHHLDDQEPKQSGLPQREDQTEVAASRRT